MTLWRHRYSSFCRMQASLASLINATEKSNASHVESSFSSALKIFLCRDLSFTRNEGKSPFSAPIRREIKPARRLSKNLSELNAVIKQSSRKRQFKRAFFVLKNQKKLLEVSLKKNYYKKRGITHRGGNYDFNSSKNI